MIDQYLNDPEIGWVYIYTTFTSELKYTKEGYIDGNIGKSIITEEKCHAIKKQDDLLENLLSRYLILSKNSIYPKMLYCLEDGKIVKEINFGSSGAWEEAFGEDWKILTGIEPLPKSILCAGNISDNQKFILSKLIDEDYSVEWEQGCFHSELTLKAPNPSLPSYKPEREDFRAINELIEERWLVGVEQDTHTTTIRRYKQIFTFHGRLLGESERDIEKVT